jgi:phospholipase/lecithinase/hemolysin
MYPSSTPLVPDDQYRERDFAPRDLDAERDLQRMRRPQRQNAMKKPSVANRMARSVSRFFAAVLSGVGLTLAGQSYSDQLNEMITGWAPSLAWLLPAQNPKKTAEAAVSSEVAQQIKLIAVDLAIVRRSVGQLAANQDQFAAKQEQMNQNIATLQQVEQDVRQQVLAPPALKIARPPAHNAPQPSLR